MYEHETDSELLCKHTGKRCFLTWTKAKQTMHRIKHNRRNKTVNLARVYRCKYCGHFHLTSAPEMFKRRNVHR